MTTDCIKIFENLANDPNFLFFAEYLEKQVEEEIKAKILSGKELSTSDYERVKIFAKIKNLPKQYAEAMKKNEKIKEREKIKNPY